MVNLKAHYINSNKPLYIALSSVYGVGHKKAQSVCYLLGLSPNMKVATVSEINLNKVLRYIEHYVVTDYDLKRENLTNIKRLVDMYAYRGLRHRHNLPARGQRTRTNAKTQKRLSPSRNYRSI
jgi:small subunit ribosomal protein S13